MAIMRIFSPFIIKPESFFLRVLFFAPVTVFLIDMWKKVCYNILVLTDERRLALKRSILKIACLLLLFAFVLTFVFSALIVCDHSCDRLSEECSFCEICQGIKNISSFTFDLISAVLLCSFMRLVFGKTDSFNRIFDTPVRLKVKLSD